MKLAILIVGVGLVLSAQFQTAAAVQSAARIKVSVNGDHLAFASVDDYKGVVDQPSEETKRQFARTVSHLTGFSSYLSKEKQSAARAKAPANSSLLIRDDYFASILNKDLVVEIGDYIFRVNPAKGRVYALPTLNKNEYADLLAENTRNPHIRTFSTGDNVLELVQSKTTAGSKLFCSDSGIGGKHNAYPGLFMCSADFVRYGLYFTLYADVSPYGSSGFPYRFEFLGGIPANQGYVDYKPRCGNEVAYAISSQGSWKLTHQVYQSYQGSTNLNKVYFMYRLKNPSNGQYLSPYVGFRMNK